MANFKILIVEDEVFIAKDIQKTLIELGYDVCGIAYNSEKALEMIYQFQPDLIMLDINIRGTKDGIQVAEVINSMHQVPFIYLTSHSDRATLDRAKLTLPAGYVVKPFKDRDLVTAIEIALYNWSEKLKKSQLEKSYVDRHAYQPLSTKEYEVFRDLVDGLNNRQIAEKQFISVNTVKTHVKNIFVKLEVTDRLSALKKIMA